MRHSRLYMALLCWIVFATIHAQLSDPREKLSISATIDGATNTDYYWNSNNERHIENGRLKHGINAKVRANLKLLGNQKFSLSISPFYNFSNRELCPDTPTPLFNVPTKHHHYGGSLTGNYNTMCFGKPLSFMAIASGNFEFRHQSNHPILWETAREWTESHLHDHARPRQTLCENEG